MAVTPTGLETAGRRLASLTEAKRDTLRAMLRVGTQWDTEVTIADTGHTVSEVYASALPMAYCDAPNEAWETLARFVLEAA